MCALIFILLLVSNLNLFKDLKNIEKHFNFMSEAPPVRAARPAAPAPAARADQFISRRATIENSGKYKVVIGHGSVVHPYAVIRPTNGPIKIGEYCIISEECVIENSIPSAGDMKGIRALFPEVVAKQHGQPFPPAVGDLDATLSETGTEGSTTPAPTAVVPPNTLVIGNHNYFGPRAKINAAAIGNCNIFEANASVGIMSVIQDGCILRATTRVTHDTFLPNFTVVEGAQSRWHVNGSVLRGPPPAPSPGMTTSIVSPTVGSSQTTFTADGEGSTEKRAEPSPSQPRAEFSAPEAAAAFLKEAARHAEAKSRMLRRQLKD